MQRREGRTLGMTLVELMIVVVIIGILAAISVVGYRKYIARARMSEATAMLAEFAAKEQLYFLDNGQYVEAHHSAVAKYPSESEDASEFWPHNLNNEFDSARTPTSIYDTDGKIPPSWRALGIRPRWQQLYCTYMANAGPPLATAGFVPGIIGPTLWASKPNIPWFYVLAVCNLGGVSGWPTSGSDLPTIKVTVLSLSHDSPALRTIDETE
jgi:prepilin-type N-terminal cleavage/methylation domain-containing protein